MKKKITVQDIKQALLDARFRETLPPELEGDVQKFLNNPGCACNHPIYKRVMQVATKQIAEYFPTKESPSPSAVEERLSRNQWGVINCSIHDLESHLKKLGPGRVQLDIARWQDQVTVVINELEEVY